MDNHHKTQNWIQNANPFIYMQLRVSIMNVVIKTARSNKTSWPEIFWQVIMAAANIASTRIALEAVRWDNYQTWSIQVIDYLNEEGLWDNTIEGDPDINNQIWKKNNDKALHAIRLLCRYDALDRIKLCKTAKEAWDILRSIFSEDFEDGWRRILDLKSWHDYWKS